MNIESSQPMNINIINHKFMLIDIPLYTASEPFQLVSYRMQRPSASNRFAKQLVEVVQRIPL